MLLDRCSKLFTVFCANSFLLPLIFTLSFCNEIHQVKQPFRRQMSPDFSPPFELINVTSRWTYGRTHGGHDQLAQYLTSNADQYWSTMSRAFDDYVQQRSEDIKRQWEKIVAKDDLVKRGQVSQKCFNVLQFMIDQPLKTEWSAKMIDSMGSLPIGLLSSNLVELGDFDQCLAVDGQFEQVNFVGKYCLATVNLPRKPYQPVIYNASVLGTSKWKVDAVELWHILDNKFSISMGVCFPSICQEKEVRAVMRSYYKILQSLEFNVTYCQSRDEPRQYNPKIWVAVTILAIPTTLVFLSVVVDLLLVPCSENSGTSFTFCRQILDCFSPISNTQKLVHMKDTTSTKTGAQSLPENTTLIDHLKSGAQKFHFLHGFRALSSAALVAAHVTATGVVISIAYPVQPFARHVIDYRANMRSPLYNALFNGGLLVHTFFLVSGLLLAYGRLSKVKMGFLAHGARRWLRYSPVMIGSICLGVSLELLGSGPLFHHDHLMVELDSNYRYWWTAALLYVHNLVPLEANPNVTSWSLAAEMQLHLVAYVLLVVYAKRGSRLTYITSGLFVLLHFVALSGTVLSGWARPIIFQHGAFSFDVLPEYLYSLRVTYLFTFNTLAPYFVGAIVGQMLLEGVVLKISPRVTKFIWTACFAITVVLFTHTYFPLQVPAEEMVIFMPGTLTTAVTLFTGVLLWSAVCGWTFYQCAVDPQNALARFLSAQIFQPFSRLSFCLFLGHFMTTWFNALQTRTTVTMTGNGMFQLVCSSLVLSYLIAYYLYLTWDAPFDNLVKLLWPTRKEKEKITKNDLFVELNKKKN